ncbi:MAG: glycosyltransferase family 2 protein [Chloroflexota bacterium]
MNKHPDTWVVVPAYNEGKAIGTVLEKLVRYPYSIVVVDDGSADNTAKVAESFPVAVLRHVFNLGQGAALQTGISYVLRFPETRYVVTFDSDGQHNPDNIERLLEPLKAGTHDVALGSRFLKEGDAQNIRLTKQLFLKLAVAFTRMSTGLNLTDTHNGLRAFTAEAAAKLRIVQNRMAHASEILSQIAALGLRVCEIPVTISYTEYSLSKGQSILNSVNILWDMARGRMR